MQPSSITLIGMSGVGKSTVGSVLAERLGYQFIDGDLLIEARVGRKLQDYLDGVGEEAFLQTERDVLLSLDLTHGRQVLAPGGSIVYIPDVMTHLGAYTRFVYLYASAQFIAARSDVSRRGIVGLGRKSFEELWSERDHLYGAAAHIRIDVEGRTSQESAELILRSLR